MYKITKKSYNVRLLGLQHEKHLKKLTQTLELQQIQKRLAF